MRCQFFLLQCTSNCNGISSNPDEDFAFKEEKLKVTVVGVDHVGR